MSDNKKKSESNCQKSIWNDKILSLSYKQAKEKSLRVFNHMYIGEKLSMTNGNITLAAKNSGLDRQALQQIMKRFDIDPGTYR